MENQIANQINIPQKKSNKTKAIFLLLFLTIFITIGVVLLSQPKQNKPGNQIHQEEEKNHLEIPEQPVVEEVEKVEIVFQIYDPQTKENYTLFKDYIPVGSNTKDYLPTIPNKEYYTSDKTWKPQIEEKVTTSKVYQTKYIPQNDINKNNIADETEEKYTITYYTDNNCKVVYKEYKNVLIGTSTPIPTPPTRKDYQFEKWSPNNKNVIVKSNAKYCAIWKETKEQNKNENTNEEQTPTLTKEDLKISTTDNKNYTFIYKNETFNAIYTTDNWKIVDSYKINKKEDMIVICSALIEKHPVHGKDMVSYRTPEDMAYEWQQHNLIYYMLPEGHEFKDNAKDVDLDPADQGKAMLEMYEDRIEPKN